MREKSKIVVIGGGASGLMAAIMAARNGADVTVLEHNSRLGKKLLATGNGKCNLTNVEQSLECYRGSNPAFVQGVLEQFSLEDTISFFSKLGIYTKNRNGWLYPASNQAASVLQVLQMEAAYQKVKCKLLEEVVEIKSLRPGFLVRTRTWEYSCDSVILAAGSPASGIEGASDSGYDLARSMGHTIMTPLPALVPLRCEGNDFRRWKGVRVEGTVSLMVDGTIFKTEQGELQLTEYGVSGIAVFQLSRYAIRLLYEGKTPYLVLDFMPDFSLEQLEAYLENRMRECPYKKKKEMLIGLFPDKLIDMLLKKELPLPKLCRQIKEYTLKVTRAHSLISAQVCSGGVSTEQICPDTMESVLEKGLYFAGEVVDIDGACGGYNLQWAWSSGAVAGRNAATNR